MRDLKHTCGTDAPYVCAACCIEAKLSDNEGYDAHTVSSGKMTAFERDIAQQARENPKLDLGKPCDGADGPLPCSKPLGHTGPHYFWRP